MLLICIFWFHFVSHCCYLVLSVCNSPAGNKKRLCFLICVSWYTNGQLKLTAVSLRDFRLAGGTQSLYPLWQGLRFVLIPSRYLAKADCRAKPGGAYFLSVGDTVFSPPTTDARLTIQFISLPTFHLEGRRILVFLIKLPSFLKQIFHIYHFLEEKYFYKKNLVVKNLFQNRFTR